MGVLRLSLGVTILHGPKNDQSLCNTIMGVLSLRIGLMEFFFFVSKILHNKNVNAIPSSCMYKLFQSSNYEIGDCFYNEDIAQNHAFRL
jgi:hypothetical protein